MLAEIMMRQLTHLIRLVDDLLELSRIRGGKFELQFKEVDIGELFRSVLEVETEDIDSKNQNVTQSINTAEKIFADDVRLSQVFINLLCNASKFTPPGVKIEISVYEREQNIVISIKETGKGIPQEMLPKIFDMFEQAEVRGDVGGLGIGLALVKEIVELHKGIVTATSEGEGMGATFTVFLPRQLSLV